MTSSSLPWPPSPSLSATAPTTPPLPSSPDRDFDTPTVQSPETPNVRALLGVSRCQEWKWDNRMMDMEQVGNDRCNRHAAPRLDTEPKDLLQIRMLGEEKVGDTEILDSVATFKVTNPSHSRRLAFKIKATCADFMACTPKAGLLAPTESVKMTVSLHLGGMKSDRRGGRGHAFLVQGMHAEEHETEWRHLADRWKTVHRDEIAERRIHISFVREEEQEEQVQLEEEVRRRSPSPIPIVAPPPPPILATRTATHANSGQDFRPRRRSPTSTHSWEGGATWGRRSGRSMHGKYSHGKIVKATLSRRSSPSSSSSSSSADERDNDRSYRDNKQRAYKPPLIPKTPLVVSKPPLCSSATQTRKETSSAMSIPDSCRSWKRSATMATQTEEEVAKPDTMRKPKSQDEQTEVIILKKKEKKKPEKTVAAMATQCTGNLVQQPNKEPTPPLPPPAVNNPSPNNHRPNSDLTTNVVTTSACAVAAAALTGLFMKHYLK